MSAVFEAYMAAKSLAERDDTFRDLPLAFLTTHVKCGGTITPELAQDGDWRNQYTEGPRFIEIGRCDRCGLAGIVCEAPQ